MIFHILVGQRVCSYPGEYAPEALEVMDDNAMGDNEEWMLEKMKEYRDSNEFTNLVILQVKVSDAEVDRVLMPSTHVNGLVL